ncbi:fatty acyl-AMP ligase [Streptomyces sp. RGM 3693]|uniref:fatty acyl-AMP ligase n=1 Tax=Streptomyces sp. RGM 3693 TaxID=3413284 RepID=UPI003D271290
MPQHRNFIELVTDRAAERPTQDALVFLTEDGTALTPERLDYAQLDRAARAVACWLQRHGASGRPVIVIQSQGRLFAAAFLGCLYAGAMAVPAPLPGGAHHNVDRLLGIIKDTAAHSVLTDSAGAPDISRLLAAHGQGSLPCLATDAMDPEDADPDAWAHPDVSEDDIAFLQYTSGSTSDPKGVMVSHRNLMSNQLAISRALGTHQETRMGSWLPFHHDMGLIGHLLHPLWLGGTGVLMPAATFVRRPVRWLQAVTDHGITAGGGPNFAYDLCLRRIRDDQLDGLDLSHWERAVNGAEPVRADTLRAFAHRFGPVGLRPQACYPCYGMAEATLIVSGATPDTGAVTRTVDAAALEDHRLTAPEDDRPTRELVSSGRPQDIEVCIVDPETRRELPDGRVGEIWLRGGSVAHGYWNRPDETQEVFRCARADGEGGYLRTGDLGALHDGELYVTGRLKDMLIVSGRNIYPQDIERTVQKVSSLFGCCTVFGVGDDRDHVVVVQELRDRGTYGTDMPALASAVRHRVTTEFEVGADCVLLVPQGTVRRTTSGKVQRGAMRALFLAGELQALHRVAGPELDRLLGPLARDPDRPAGQPGQN